MSINELFSQLYYSGLLALSIMALAIAIIIYPTLKKRAGRDSSNKSISHRIRK